MLLSSSKIAGSIKQRQARAVTQLRKQGIAPKLAIVKANQDAASAAYIGAKQRYGSDIGAVVEVYDIGAARLESIITQLNSEPLVHGMIIQLPLPAGVDSDNIIDLVTDSKDVDGLKASSPFDSPTPTAILWLLEAYGIDLKGQQALIIGRGRLVGKPLGEIFKRSHINFTSADEHTPDLKAKIMTADVIISATGHPGLLTINLVKPGAVIVDAGTAEAGGKLVGDADPELYQRDDLKISPVPGGVGPLTVCALFANLIKAAEYDGSTG